jgi:cbb3-type cytochrome oxidase subunit 3
MSVIFALVTSHRIKASYEASSIQLDDELDDAVLESDSRVVV